MQIWRPATAQCHEFSLEHPVFCHLRKRDMKDVVTRGGLIGAICPLGVIRVLAVVGARAVPALRISPRALVTGCLGCTAERITQRNREKEKRRRGTSVFSFFCSVRSVQRRPPDRRVAGWARALKTHPHDMAAPRVQRGNRSKERAVLQRRIGQLYRMFM